jgi:hypothetical protein
MVVGQFGFWIPVAGVARVPLAGYTSGMPKRSSKQKDPSEIARHVLDAVVPDAESTPTPPEEAKPEKNPAAVALGRLGGLKGGKARAAKLTAKTRVAIARKAAQARWKRSEKP